MKSGFASGVFLASLVGASCAGAFTPSVSNTLSRTEKAAGWKLLFDGKSIDDWRPSDAPGTFVVHDGQIVVHGPTSHLFYVGDVEQHDFRNFELRLDVMTSPKANSGVYFHTLWQERGWPEHGYEVQVNNSHSDPKRTAGLYDVVDNYQVVARDGVWFTLFVRVSGKHIVTSVNGRIVVDFTEPEDWTPPANHPERRVAHGTFALQGHDRGSETHFRNIKVRALP